MTNYNSKEFKELRSVWYNKLKESNFKDLEDQYGNLYSHDIRTIAWKNKEVIREFFFALDEYLEHKARIPHKHWIVLRNWSAGMYLIEISRKTRTSVRTIDRIIAKYKKIVLELEET